ncbi:S1 family peptidase [Streptomyces sp. NPDC056210]|uniref:S1 family peptidase n=1 Tax=Streptomyces sp. NPDC056210 TaxID=3345746 RepID=UPI0035D68108
MKKASVVVGSLAVASSVAYVLVQGVSPIEAVQPVTVSEAREELTEKADIPGTSWAVDPETNKLVVTADKTVKGDDLEDLKNVTDDLGDVVEFQNTNHVMRPYINGGEAMLSSERCSAGFNVVLAGNPFLVTAGHCGKKGSEWRDKSGAAIGTMVESVFPLDDYALVKYNTGSYPSAVNLYNGTNRIFTLGTPTIGMQVSRSGSTTGVQNGRITGLNATVNYGNGLTVDGLIQTNVCAEPGDSGGPLFSGGMGLGILSGGYGNCKTGGVTYYQPMNELVTKYSLTLPK